MSVTNRYRGKGGCDVGFDFLHSEKVESGFVVNDDSHHGASPHFGNPVKIESWLRDIAIAQVAIAPSVSRNTLKRSTLASFEFLVREK